jgi:predicted metal-dependent hydrolase
VKRSVKRRSASIQVFPDSRIVVSVPLYFPDTKVKTLLDLRRAWIVKKLKEVEKFGEVKPAREFKSGEIFSILGKQYTLQVIRQPVERIWLQENLLVVALVPGISIAREPAAVKRKLQAWLTSFALEKFQARIEHYAPLLSAKPQRVSVKNYRSRWGACKSSGDLIFNWRLIFAPEEIIDYVVVHELSHLRVFSHSPKFWKLLSSMHPKHKEATQWLRIMDYRGDLRF